MKQAILTLEQFAQRFDQLQAHIRQQAAHIMVRLDGGGRAFEGDGLDHIRIQGTLQQKVKCAGMLLLELLF